MEPGALRLGYFPNVTHAQALVGVRDGTFSRSLGPTRLIPRTFNAGPAAVEALIAGALDATYVGSGPALVAYARSKGKVVVVAGAASGGAGLFARTALTPEALRGAKIGSPQLGNSQDVALRHWLRARGFEAQVIPLSNPDILAMMRFGALEAAWVPEPWGARLRAEGGAHLLLDERDLWKDGRFPSTVLLMTRRFLELRRGDALALVRAHLELTARSQREPQAFATAANEAYGALTHHPLSEEVLRDAFSRLELLADPLPEALIRCGQHAIELGYLPPAELSGLVDSSLLSSAAP